MSSLAARGRSTDNSGVEQPVQAPAELPLRPQDEVECRRCEVHCDKVVYPGACIERSCPFVYAYEAWGHTYFGGMRATGAPLPMCKVEVSACYESRSDEIGCRNPEFHEVPRERPSFRVFAQITPRD